MSIVITAEECKRRKEAVEQALLEGFCPVGVYGGRGSAIRQAARTLAMDATTLLSSVTAGHVQPDWDLYRPPEIRPFTAYPGRLFAEMTDGVILVASDCHFWPGDKSTAFRAFVRACREFSPKFVVMNGDVVDGATISRHAPINWEERPSVAAELEACKDRLGEIADAAGGAKRYWTMGNHDQRFEARLAAVAPEYANVHGIHLKDHFAAWEPCWSLWINDDVVIKHRYKGGIHATHNNAMWAGKSIITGHLHSLKVTPISDYSINTRFGVDTGTLADVYGPQFEYMEDNVRNWRSGFAVLTFYRSKLLWPELVHVLGDGQVEFRGKVYSV